MKKFVTMHTINNAFDDIDLIDYIAVQDVTDSMLKLNIHPKNRVTEKDYKIIDERCIVLGKILERKVQFKIINKNLFTSILSKISSHKN